MRHQQGASYIGVLFAIVGFAFLAKVAIAVWGPYFDDRMVDGEIEALLKSGVHDGAYLDGYEEYGQLYSV